MSISSSNGKDMNEQHMMKESQTIEDVTTKELNVIISEFLANEKTELPKIHSLSSKISNKLLTQRQENLEQKTLRLEKGC